MEAKKSMLKVLADLLCCESPLLGLQMDSFSHGREGREGGRERQSQRERERERERERDRKRTLQFISIRALIPLMGAPPS